MAEHINTCEEYIDDTTQVNIHDTVEKYLHGPTNFDFNTYSVFLETILPKTSHSRRRPFDCLPVCLNSFCS
jgi:hypothetical protein